MDAQSLHTRLVGSKADRHEQGYSSTHSRQPRSRMARGESVRYRQVREAPNTPHATVLQPPCTPQQSAASRLATRPHAIDRTAPAQSTAHYRLNVPMQPCSSYARIVMQPCPSCARSRCGHARSTCIHACNVAATQALAHTIMQASVEPYTGDVERTCT